ncbi:MAG: hypothetical protein IKS56_09645 [Lachnospiraceae bacterium]|nr:hypothetical protein [Lachnospiraceae bacterium]
MKKSFICLLSIFIGILFIFGCTSTQENVIELTSETEEVVIETEPINSSEETEEELIIEKEEISEYAQVPAELVDENGVYHPADVTADMLRERFEEINRYFEEQSFTDRNVQEVYGMIIRANYSFIPEEDFRIIMEEYDPDIFSKYRNGTIVYNREDSKEIDQKLLQLVYFDPYLNYQAQRLYEEYEILEEAHPYNGYGTRHNDDEIVIYSNRGNSYISCMQFGKEYYEELLQYREELYDYLKNDKTLIRKMEYCEEIKLLKYANVNRIHYRGDYESTNGYNFIKLENNPYMNIPDEIEEPAWETFPFNCGKEGVKVYDKTDFDYPMALYEMLECFVSWGRTYYEEYLIIKYDYDYDNYYKDPYSDFLGDIFTEYKPEDCDWGSNIEG